MNDPAPDRRLRIGLLSGSMRTHPVGWLTIAGFENLDPAQQTLIGLAHRRQRSHCPPLPRDRAGMARHRALDDAVPWRHSAAMTALTFWSISAVSAMPGVSRPSRIGPHPCRSNGSGCRPTPPACRRQTGSSPTAGKHPPAPRPCIQRTAAAPAGRLRLLQSAALRTRPAPLPARTPDTSRLAASPTSPRSPRALSPPGRRSSRGCPAPAWW